MTNSKASKNKPKEAKRPAARFQVRITRNVGVDRFTNAVAALQQVEEALAESREIVAVLRREIRAFSSSTKVLQEEAAMYEAEASAFYVALRDAVGRDDMDIDVYESIFSSVRVLVDASSAGATHVASSGKGKAAMLRGKAKKRTKRTEFAKCTTPHIPPPSMAERRAREGRVNRTAQSDTENCERFDDDEVDMDWRP